LITPPRAREKKDHRRPVTMIQGPKKKIVKAEG